MLWALWSTIIIAPQVKDVVGTCRFFDIGQDGMELGTYLPLVLMIPLRFPNTLPLHNAPVLERGGMYSTTRMLGTMSTPLIFKDDVVMTVTTAGDEHSSDDHWKCALCVLACAFSLFTPPKLLRKRGEG